MREASASETMLLMVERLRDAARSDRPDINVSRADLIGILAERDSLRSSVCRLADWHTFPDPSTDTRLMKAYAEASRQETAIAGVHAAILSEGGSVA